MNGVIKFDILRCFYFFLTTDGAAARAGVQQGDRIVKVCINLFHLLIHQRVNLT
jgi:hypothetical protein